MNKTAELHKKIREWIDKVGEAGVVSIDVETSGGPVIAVNNLKDAEQIAKQYGYRVVAVDKYTVPIRRDEMLTKSEWELRVPNMIRKQAPWRFEG